uniref:Retrotransposon gag domain-containing protein n=1 Tax=Aegilops tauschii subsp. strangulata TaxID=200361 RepID=A0A453EG05_AEGTS
MSETSGEIKSLLESLLTRFEASQITAAKHVEAQLAFNEQVSSDLTHLRRQMDLTQADVDEVRQQRPDPDKQQAAASSHQHQFMPRGGAPQVSSRVQGPVARLVNDGPPLIPQRPVVTITGAGQMPPPASPRGLPQALHADDYYVKPPKHDFPKFDGTLSNKFFITQFLLGLRDDLRAAVRLQAPTSITRASVLARIQEEEADAHRPRPRVFPVGRPPTHPIALPPRPQAAPRPAAAPAAAGGDDFARERQLRDHRRAHGLCFRCGDRYSREHRCKQATQLLTIHMGEHGEILTEDAIQAMELLDDQGAAPADQECCVLSTQAVSGTETPRTIRLRALVGNQVMLLLVNSGSTHSFISASFAERIAATTTPLPPVDVRVANGERLVCDKLVPGVKWWLQGHTFTTDMRQLTLGAYDGVLGMDWLEQFSPMSCHWLNKTLTFEHEGATITLQGVRQSAVQSLEPIEPEQFNKWQAGNDIWYMALIDRQPPSSDTVSKLPV